ncbi:MAG: RecQ family ATP-dependent DNA helicase [Verrucomicrobia bacterium]|jgi:ATP-dependent DNA helicase RecQ|nr:RecQ family ATP-dependent DNA helicase [Verrucomicrobiota bacterium]
MEQAQAQALLKQTLGPNAEFREGQWEAIDQIANQRRRLLVVQRTGWGKSIVYFLAAKILRDAGDGPTLLISPLLSLMRNQLLATEKLGVRAATIHSENVQDWGEVEAALAGNHLDLLMVSPERLANPDFMQKLLPLLQGRVGLFVVDEAHCISDWGHDFRPDYRRILQVMKLLPPGVPVLCTTATANDRVVRDIETQIPQLQVLRGPLVRSSLRLYNVCLAHQSDRLAWLAHFLPQLPGNGIVYCLTIQDARRVAAWLQRNNISARAYHADLEGAERVATEGQLLHNEVKALVATVALGMGFDKPDLGFVIHFQRPGSVVAYYQQVGRAGRAMDSAFGILLSGSEDDEISDYFIRTAFPPVEVLQGVLAALEKRGPLTVDDIGAELNQGRGAIEKALKLLEVDGAVTHDKRGYSRTANPWQPDAARFEQVTRLRRDEVEQMRRYVEHKGCLMEFLARALDDPNAAPCGKCMNCTKHTERRIVPAELTQAAVDFLRGDALVLEPRLRWPKPLLEEIRSALPTAVEFGDKGALKTTIPEKLRADTGRVLCIWGDSGWGDEVARGKYEAGRFSDALVEASAALVREKWKPAPPPGWVTAVPSARRAELVNGFAQRLASKLNLPFAPILRRARVIRPQKEMQNGVQQVRNLLGAFAIEGTPRPGGVLLVDDVVDSGWTLTLLAVLLRQRGSGPVYPFALAKASPRGG